AADEQVLEVVAGIVFFELAEIVEHLARGQHNLDAQAKVACGAVGKRAYPAGIGGKVATDLARALRGKRERKEPVPLRCRFLEYLKHDACFDSRRIRRKVDLADAVEAREGDDHLLASLVRHLPADEAGIATLGHDRRARFGGK